MTKIFLGLALAGLLFWGLDRLGLMVRRSGWSVRAKTGSTLSRWWGQMDFSGRMSRNFRPGARYDVLEGEIQAASGSLTVEISRDGETLYLWPDIRGRAEIRADLSAEKRVRVTLLGKNYQGSFRLELQKSGETGD